MVSGNSGTLGGSDLQDMFSLKGKVALVTGAGRGIGHAIAADFHAAGAQVIMVDRDECVTDRAARLAAPGSSVASIVEDLTDEAGIARIVQEVSANHRHLDVLVNNAAVLLSKPPREIERSRWQQVIDTNLSASFFLAQAALPLLERAGSATIINLSSMVGKTARRNLSAYIAAKSGIDGLTRALACDLAGTGITVNAIAPGFIETEMSRTGSESFDKYVSETVPVRRWGTPRDISAVAVFLAGAAAGYVNGQTIYVDGGFTAMSR